MILPNPYPAASVAARRHAEIEWPKESVGFVLTNGDYVPLINTHPDPENHFRISHEDEDLYRDEKAAVVHSHCVKAGSFHASDGPLAAGPSAHDMAQQLVSGCPWGLVVVFDGLGQDSVIWWGDELPEVPPLLGRPFVHGVYDCYSIIRDHHRLDSYGFIRDYYGVDSIVLPEFPRDFGWWAKDEEGRMPMAHLYETGFAKAGFRRISQEEIRPGDVFLASVLAPGITNHGGVYLGNGEILHHLRGRLSKTDVASRWLDYVTHYLRYEGIT